MATPITYDPIPVPSLSPSGWITAPAEKADALFSHFYMSDGLQSSLFPGQVANIQSLVEQYGDNPSRFVQQLEATLRRYIFAFYPEGMDVQAEAIDLGTDRFDVRLTITVVQGGKQHNFANLINVVNSKIAGIIRSMNEGD